MRVVLLHFYFCLTFSASVNLGEIVTVVLKGYSFGEEHLYILNVSSAFGEKLNLTWTSAAFPQRVTGSYHLDRGGTRYGGATACSLSADYKNFLSDCGSSLYSVVGSDPNLLMWKTLGPVLCLLCPLKVMVSFCLF